MSKITLKPRFRKFVDDEFVHPRTGRLVKDGRKPVEVDESGDYDQVTLNITALEKQAGGKLQESQLDRLEAHLKARYGLETWACSINEVEYANGTTVFMNLAKVGSSSDEHEFEL